MAAHSDYKLALNATQLGKVQFYDNKQCNQLVLKVGKDEAVNTVLRSPAYCADFCLEIGDLQGGKDSKHCCVGQTEIIVGQHDADRTLRGVKTGLKSKVSKMTVKEFHKHYGHLGCDADCLICKMIKGAARRIYKKVDPHQENRPGFKWHMDTVTWNTRSSRGNRFMTCLRDEASGLFKVLIHYLKDDITDVLKKYIETIRADPCFHDCPYKVFSELNLDNAGEWAPKCTVFQNMMDLVGTEAVYSCPDRKESNSQAEKTCGILEICIKGLLMQNNLPAWWWERCAISAEFLLNRFPMSSAGPNDPSDGDRTRPLENFTRFKYSRRQIDRELSYFIPPGTPCLVQTEAKGSALEPKTRWGVAVAMFREQVIFICPYTGVEFRSKSYAAFRLQDGLNYLQFLGLPEVETARGRVAIPFEIEGGVVVKLPKHNQGLKNQAKEPVLGVEVAGDMVTNPPIIHSTTETTSKLGGHLKIYDSQGRRAVGPDLTPVDCAQVRSDSEDESSEEDEITAGVKPAGIVAEGVPSVVIKADAKIDKLFDMADASKVKHKSVFTKGNESFVRVCKTMGLEFEQHQIYNNWLITECGFTPEILPTEGYAKLQPGLEIPYPSGKKWRLAIQHQSRKWKRAQYAAAIDNERAFTAANQWVESQMTLQRQLVAEGGSYCFSIGEGRKAMCASIFAKKGRAMSACKRRKVQGLRKTMSKALIKSCMAGRRDTANNSKPKKIKFKRKTVKAVATGVVPAPKNCRAALEAEDADDWVKSQGNEYYGLVELGVLDLNFTRQQLIEEGVINPDTPIPIGDYYELKFNAEGEVNKKKSRFAVKGHPGNMQKGVHYDKTFAATPRENTARFICALVVLLNLFRGAFDITKAYCWADRPKDKLLALKYPDGFQEYHPETGEELFLILRKNLYGDPAAGRLFGKARDKVLLKKFNSDGFHCTRCRMDPCLFVITYEGKRAWMLAHVDDCDIVADTQELVDQVKGVCATIWKITYADPEFMLGVRRRLTYDSDGKVQTCNLDMISYVEGMAEAFKEHLPKGKVRQPVEKGMFISKDDNVSEEESVSVIEAGYQVAIGMLMWAVRQCYPVGKVAVSMFCRIMAKPHWAAFHQAMHLIAWLFQERTVGIKFSHCGNNIPMGMVDASNKPDPADGKAQFGGLFMFMGATILDISRKLRHCGLSSEHNEYMAMYYIHQALIWLRQLITEMGLSELLLQKPTIMMADNLAANNLSREDVMTHGNQYMYLPFHYNKEVQEQGFSHVVYINTTRNIADLTTKCSGAAELKALRGALTGHDTRLVMELANECAIIQAELPSHIQFKDFIQDSRWWIDSDVQNLIEYQDKKV